MVFRKVMPWSLQRGTILKFDEALRRPGILREQRGRGACVVCAQQFWKHELKQLILFTDPGETELPKRSRQLQVFALFRRAVRNMASVENEVPFKPKMTETCVSSKKNAICHDAMFCRPAAPASIESNEFEHPQRVDSKSDRGLSGFALLPLGPVSPR